MKKILCLFVLFGMLPLCTLSVSASADSGLIGEQKWQELEKSLPEELREELLEGVNGVEDYADTVISKSGSEELISKILDVVSIEIVDILKLFLAILALTVISAVFGTAGASIADASLNGAIRLCSVGSMLVLIVYAQYEHFLRIESFFDSLGTLMRAMIPMCAGIWAMGGNVSTATVGSASLFLMLSVCEGLLRNSVIPVCCVMSVLGLCDAMSDEMKTGRLLGAIKKIYTVFLGFIMTLLLSSLSAQTAIAASADTTASRTARLLSGNLIPIIGGGVGETLRTVGGGVAYLKNVFGIGGIIMIVYLLLPIGMSVLLTRVVFLLSGGIAEMLGCSNEARLLGHLGEIYGSMLAVISGVCVSFVLALCVFMQTVIAVV